MQQIIISYNRRTSSISFDLVQNAGKYHKSSPRYPSKEPGIITFYINRQIHLHQMLYQKDTQYQGYQSLEPQSEPTQYKWLQYFENGLNPSITNVVPQYQEALQYRQLSIRDSQSESAEENDAVWPSDLSFSFQPILQFPNSRSSESFYLSNQKQSGQISFCEPYHKPQQNSLQFSNSSSFSFLKTQNYERQTFQEEQTSIQSTFLNRKPHSSIQQIIPERIFEQTSPLTIKIQEVNSSIPNPLNDALLKFVSHPLLLGINLLELSTLCTSIDSSKQSSLNLSFQNSNSDDTSQNFTFNSKNTKGINKKTKKEQKKMEQALKILMEFYDILDKFQSIQIIKRFKMLERQERSRIKIQNCLQNDSMIFEEGEIYQSDLDFKEQTESPQVCRLIQILSLLQSLKQRNMEI